MPARSTVEHVLERNRVTVRGVQGAPIVFLHGFGWDQAAWRLVAPRFEGRHQVVLYDITGLGHSDRTAYDFEKYSSLDGHVADLFEIWDALNLERVVLVGHSAGALIALRAAIEQPGRVEKIALITASPYYLATEEYASAMTLDQFQEMLQTMERNYAGWSAGLAPQVMQNPDVPTLKEEFEAKLNAADPRIIRHIARVVFLTDNRPLLPRIRTPSLLVQARDDTMASRGAGRYMHEHIPESRLVFLQATGHCPLLSGPEELQQVLEEFIDGRG